MGEGKRLWVRRKQLRKLLERKPAIVAYWHEAQPDAHSFSQQLPWHQVAVMLHFREEDHVSSPKKFCAPRMRHKVYAFRSSARKHDFVRRRSVQVARHALARSFVSFRRTRAQLVKPTMHVGVFVLVVMPKRIDYRPRFLRRRGTVKVDQGMTTRLFAEDREILAEGIPIYRAGRNLVHTLICPTCCHAPL